MARVLVTGAEGFIGRNLVEALVNKRVDVIGVPRMDLPEVKPDIIYHLADTNGDPRGILNLILKYPKVKKIIFISSVEVYRKKQTDYSLGKQLGEKILMVAESIRGFEFQIFRLHPVYGKYQNPKRSVVARFMQDMKTGKESILYADGKTKRYFTYIDDVIETILSHEVENNIVDIGSQRETSVIELYKLIHLIARPRISAASPYEGRKNDTKRFPGENNHLLSETPLPEGLMKTWEWYNQ